MSTLRAVEGQSIFDVIIQEFGTLENYANFVSDNPDIDINVDFVSGQEVEINSNNLGNEDVKGEYKRLAFVTNNQDGLFVEAIEQKQFEDGDPFDFEDGTPYQF